MSRTKDDMAKYIAKELVMTKKDALAVINTAIDYIKESNAEGEKVQLIGFGSFTPYVRKSYYGMHPKTKKEVLHEECVIPKFKPAKAYTEQVKQLDPKHL